ncbi:MAG: hypothetical protein LBP59_17845 [Planctomycetaceae bacterium]|nr:hypothetical protein [Planctomycetaceae bacterium]
MNLWFLEVPYSYPDGGKHKIKVRKFRRILTCHVAAGCYVLLFQGDN